MSNDYLNHRRNPGERPPADAAPAEGAASVAGPGPLSPQNVTVFRCVNCSQAGAASALAVGRALSAPEWERPIAVREVALPCTGRLQPEHLLKAFEAGADAVCVIDCAGDECRYLEGSQRAERRAEYVGKLLDEIGLDSQRLMLFHLGGSADPTLERAPAGLSPDAHLNQGQVGARLAAIYEVVLARLGALPPSPLRRDGSTV